MYRHVQTCSGHYLSYLLVFLFKSISKICVMQERETLNECFVVFTSCHEILLGLNIDQFMFILLFLKLGLILNILTKLDLELAE